VVVSEASHGHRFERTGQVSDLNEAVAAARDAIAATPPDHANHPDYLSDLGWPAS
jgi:hypothetical protein